MRFIHSVSKPEHVVSSHCGKRRAKSLRELGKLSISALFVYEGFHVRA